MRFVVQENTFLNCKIDCSMKDEKKYDELIKLLLSLTDEDFQFNVLSKEEFELCDK